MCCKATLGPRSERRSKTTARRTNWCSSVENRVDEGSVGFFTENVDAGLGSAENSSSNSSNE
jgi:hypothetical protein